MEKKSQHEDVNWYAVLGMMAALLLSFGIYGAAVGAYLTLLGPA
jgi:hypothetical protein